ncbi:hypothetical protein H9P43_009224 [Blastocladiella emersonii ATCC 22665]|nr:hypothetical protein H9P43_009224 [Blastocladiella emersonii ATCC 22665]
MSTTPKPTTSTSARAAKHVKSADLVRDKNVKRLCCGCMEIRRGVIALLVLTLVFGAILAALTFADGPYFLRVRDELGSNTPKFYIHATIMVVQLVLAVWGLFAVLMREVGQYKIFAIANIVLVVIGVVDTIVFGDWSNAAGVASFELILTSIINGYFAYVFYSYIATMRAEKEALEAI